jgi:hypothetical protein
MAAKRLSMRQIREILRQKWPLGLSHRAVAQSLGVGLGTISSVVARAQGAGLDWPQVQSLSDDVLEGRLYGRPDLAGQRQRPSEQIGVLSDECDLPAQVVEPIASEIVAPQADGAAVWVPEPQEQVGDRRDSNTSTSAGRWRPGYVKRTPTISSAGSSPAGVAGDTPVHRRR